MLTEDHLSAIGLGEDKFVVLAASLPRENEGVGDRHILGANAKPMPPGKVRHTVFLTVFQKLLLQRGFFRENSAVFGRDEPDHRCTPGCEYVIKSISKIVIPVKGFGTRRARMLMFTNNSQKNVKMFLTEGKNRGRVIAWIST
jgi:hypothetical protein